MTVVVLTVIAALAIVANVAIVLIGAKLAPKPPDLYLSINVVPEIEEDDGDDPDEEDIEAEVVPDEYPADDPTVRTN